MINVQLQLKKYIENVAHMWDVVVIFNEMDFYYQQQ